MKQTKTDKKMAIRHTKRCMYVKTQRQTNRYVVQMNTQTERQEKRETQIEQVDRQRDVWTEDK